MDLNIELELFVFVFSLLFFLISVACFNPPLPTRGDLLPKGNLLVERRVPVLNVLHLVALKHEFAWLPLAVCRASFNFLCVLAALGSSVFGLQ